MQKTKSKFILQLIPLGIIVITGSTFSVPSDNSSQDNSSVHTTTALSSPSSGQTPYANLSSILPLHEQRSNLEHEQTLSLMKEYEQTLSLMNRAISTNISNEKEQKPEQIEDITNKESHYLSLEEWKKWRRSQEAKDLSQRDLNGKKANNRRKSLRITVATMLHNFANKISNEEKCLAQPPVEELVRPITEEDLANNSSKNVVEESSKATVSHQLSRAFTVVSFVNLHSNRADKCMELCQRRLRNAIRYMKKNNADPNTQDNTSGNTALHLAVLLDNRNRAEQILNFSTTNPNIINKEGNTPLLVAMRTKKFDIAKLLIKKNADLTIADPEGNTVLHCAAIADQPEIIEQLLTGNKASIGIQNKAGQTPLHLAILNGNTNSAQILLQTAPKEMLFIADHRGQTPLYYAAKKANGAIVTSLLQAGTYTQETLQKIILKTKKTDIKELLSNYCNTNIDVSDDNYANIPKEELDGINNQALNPTVEVAAERVDPTNRYGKVPLESTTQKEDAQEETERPSSASTIVSSNGENSVQYGYLGTSEIN